MFAVRTYQARIRQAGSKPLADRPGSWIAKASMERPSWTPKAPAPDYFSTPEPEDIYAGAAFAPAPPSQTPAQSACFCPLPLAKVSIEVESSDGLKDRDLMDDAVWGISRRGSELTFSLALSRSEQQLHLKDVPASRCGSEQHLCSGAHTSSARRVLKLRVEPRRATRACTLCVLLSYLPLAASLVTVAFAAHSYRVNSAVGLTTAPHRRTTLLSTSQAWLLPPPSEPAWKGIARGSHTMTTTMASKMRTAADGANTLADRMRDAADQELQRLRYQLSPLAATVDGACSEYSAPPHIVALAGIAMAAALAVTSDEPPTPRSAQGPQERCTPPGFDTPLAIECAQLSGLTYQQDPEVFRAELREMGLTLLSEFEDKKQETYAYLAQRADQVFLVFRGSWSVKNALTDIDYQHCDSFQELARLSMPQGVKLHRGFLSAWCGLREPILAELERLQATHAHGLRLHVTGHSMGGAMAMLASLEAQHLMEAREENPLAQHTTYTFAAPRVGNAQFAEMYQQAFPADEAHWALQHSEDAVPHLPFVAWGYQHPHGVAVLDERQPLRRTGDPGDSVSMLRPKDGSPKNWATIHDTSVYVDRMRALISLDGLPQPSAQPAWGI